MIVVDIAVLVAIGMNLITVWLLLESYRIGKIKEQINCQLAKAISERNALLKRLLYEVELHGCNDQLLIEEVHTMLDEPTTIEGLLNSTNNEKMK